VALEKSWIDFSAGWINVPPAVGRRKKVAPIKMTSAVRETLMKVIASSDRGCPFVFADEMGRPYSPNRVSVAFGRACREAAIVDLRFHDLRHDFATLLINNGASLYQVQHQLGHTNVRTTQRYAHLLPEKQNIVDRIDGVGTKTILRQSKEKAYDDKS
jgi:integrase